MAAPSPTVKKLDDIKSALLRPALTSHFICEFSIPGDVNAGLGKFLSQRGVPYNQELIKLSCSEASLPGSSLATIDIENDYHGVSEKHAYRRLYDDRADFTFYVDGDYNIIRFFETWISYCVGENDIKLQGTRQYSYRVNYPKDYKTDNLYITKFERNIGTKEKASNFLQYQFLNAYPISINSMPVSYDTSQLLKCTVSFYYSRYVVTDFVGTGENSSNPENPEISLPTQSNSVTLFNSSGQPDVTRVIEDGRSLLAQLND